jgi:predicted kinase
MLTAYVLVGAPGAGKSTHAAKLAEKENAVVISLDRIRHDLYGSASREGNWDEIWNQVDEMVSESCGMPVILDGTFYRRDYRSEAITLLRSYGYDRVEAIVMETSLATCLARNFKRARNVPDYVVKQMHADLTISLKTIMEEDFDRVTFAR